MFCFECIRGHVSAKVTENISKVRCPDPNCKGVIGPEVCWSIVPKEVLIQWEKALCESLIIGAEKFYCMSCSKYQSLGKDERDPSDIMLMNLAKNKNWKRCPNCHFYVEKNTGYEHISCRCGYNFCYECNYKYVEGHLCQRAA
nr:zinc finger, C6HC-type [Tanacetum cinerariifolium]